MLSIRVMMISFEESNVNCKDAAKCRIGAGSLWTRLYRQILERSDHQNHFPTASGLASSASGFAALAVAARARAAAGGVLPAARRVSVETPLDGQARTKNSFIIN